MNRLSVSVMAMALVLGTQGARAEDEKSVTELPRTEGIERSANEIIGKKVVNNQNDDLGKIHDLIVNVESGTAPYAVVALGGIFSPGRSKVAVPLTSLRYSSDRSHLVMSATKDQLESASKTATGAWGPVAESAWAAKVDAFYGQPMAQHDYARDKDTTAKRDAEGTRSFVRDPVPKGAELLATPQDDVICERVCESVDAVQVRVQNGVTHIYGKVENEQAREDLEAQVRAVPGVNTVKSHLKVKNP